MRYRIQFFACFIALFASFSSITNCRPLAKEDPVNWEQLTTSHAAAPQVNLDPGGGTGMIGINLGNTLDAVPTEGSWTSGALAQQYYFSDYATAGFNSVRITITWNGHTGGTSPYTIDPAWMNRVETVVSWAIGAGLAAMINCHHEDWLYKDYANKIERLDAIWTQVAARFKDVPASDLIFEIMNEPYSHTDGEPPYWTITDAQVNDMNQRELDIIRTSGGNNATRWVVIGPNDWNGLWSLQDMEIPLNLARDNPDPYLIANFHDYNPWSFGGMGQEFWGSPSDLNAFANEMQVVKNWSEANNDIPVMVNEYGVIRKYGAVWKDPASRILWYETLSAHARANGFSYFAWDDSGDFGIYERSERLFEAGLLRAIFGP